jgi:hypothetical protein
MPRCSAAAPAASSSASASRGALTCSGVCACVLGRHGCGAGVSPQCPANYGVRVVWGERRVVYGRVHWGLWRWLALQLGLSLPCFYLGL